MDGFDARAVACSPGGAALTPASDGYLYIDRDQFHEAFCADVPEDEARVMAAAQKPLAAAIFGATYEDAARTTTH